MKTSNVKKGEPNIVDSPLELAERTGLEPATPGVTGRYSNQLNYRSGKAPQYSSQRELVGADGVEPPTFAL